MAPQSARAQAWQRLARDLDMGKLASITPEIALGEAIAVAADLMDGKVRGRIVVVDNRELQVIYGENRPLALVLSVYDAMNNVASSYSSSRATVLRRRFVLRRLRGGGDMGKHEAATCSPANYLRRKAHHGPWNLVISLPISGQC